MQGPRLIRTLRLTNFLSYGSESQEVTLEPLNVLIGPNSSGKSNLIEAVSILQATPKDLLAPIREGGGIADWLWKGTKGDATAEIEASLYYPTGPTALRYRLAFTRTGQRMELVDEALESDRLSSLHDDVYFFYRFQGGHPVINVRTTEDAIEGFEKRPEKEGKRSLRRQDIDFEQSVLSQRKDPDQYPELTYVGNQFASIRLYREWNLGRYTPPRVPQKADLPEDFLMENSSNLALVMNNLEHQPGIKHILIEKLKRLNAEVNDLTVKIHGGTVQLYLHESGISEPIPATRLSDGTLRYLCLLTILVHPVPPPLICIEEPELGLHPDVLPTIAELLVDASHRTQLIITTHSDTLVSALTEYPESVLVCEHDSQGTRLTRLAKERLAEWLEKYSLGELWRMGEIGGTL